ncbi:MAG: hypothetical protein E7612_09800 [Ruminococcaceae bacterium]|nr:hypothetical protein [Oscillospiraceae bacterium]
MKHKAPKKRRQPIFFFVRAFFSIFLKSTVESEIDVIPENAIIVANHSAKSGPMAIEVSYPHFNVKWGAYQMMEGYRSRFLYLRNVLYRQKLGRGRVYSSIKAFFEAIPSKMLYRGMKFIPTYPDARFRHSIRLSIEVLENGGSILVFPEDSSKGYLDELTSAFPGFVMLAEQYLRKTGVDLPIIPMYFSRSERRIIVGKPSYAGELRKKGMSREGVADFMKDEINSLYRRYIKKN